jgi:hypothetical protein
MSVILLTHFDTLVVPVANFDEKIGRIAAGDGQ